MDFDFWNLVYWPLPRFLSATSAKQRSWNEQSRPLWITDIGENVYTTLSITVWTEFIGTAKRQHVCRCCLSHQMMLSENKLLKPAMDLSCKDPEGHLWVGTVASSFDGADVSLCNQYRKIMIFFHISRYQYKSQYKSNPYLCQAPYSLVKKCRLSLI